MAYIKEILRAAKFRPDEKHLSGPYRRYQKAAAFWIAIAALVALVLTICGMDATFLVCVCLIPAMLLSVLMDVESWYLIERAMAEKYKADKAKKFPEESTADENIE